MTGKLVLGMAVVACAVAAGIAAGASAASATRTPAQALESASAPRGDLARTRTVDYRGFRVERFQQRVDGYPVIGGQATVVGGAGEPATLAADATSAPAAKVAPAAAKPSLSRSRAIAAARSATAVRAIRAGDRPSADLAIDPTRGGVLVWRVELPSARPTRDYEVLVDARTGDVLSKANLLRYATDKAKLYVPNPPAEQGSYAGIGTTPAADHNDHDTKKLTSLREAVKLPRVQGHCLKGRFVNALYDRKAKKACRDGRNWKGVTRSNDKFEALMAYFHIDRTQAYIQSLGFTTDNHTAINDRRQTVVADAFPADNSFYSPQDRRIRYGAGGVDDAEDGDVIVHEYGHSIQDNQDPGFGCHGANFCQAGALGEGFGDYNSAMMSLQTPGLPDPTHAAFCIFDWDGTGGYNPTAAPCGRVADGSDGISTLPQAVAAGGPCDFGRPGQPAVDIHCVGEVWTHGLLDLRLNPAIGQHMDVDVLASQFSYVDSETFAQAVNALISADTSIYGGVDVAAICAEMKTARGISGTSCP